MKKLLLLFSILCIFSACNRTGIRIDLSEQEFHDFVLEWALYRDVTIRTYMKNRHCSREQATIEVEKIVKETVIRLRPTMDEELRKIRNK